MREKEFEQATEGKNNHVKDRRDKALNFNKT